MNRILFILVAAVAVLLAVVLFLPGLIPVGAFKGQIEAKASEALGREVTIGDNLSFRVFPRTAFHVEDLEIANAEGFEGDYLARVDEADIGVKLIPLLSQSVEIDRFVLTRPDIRLVRARDGSVNWNLAANDAAPAEETSAGGGELRDLKLGDVRIVEGAARYEDAASGASYAMEEIDLAVVLNSLSEPLEAKGDMLFQGAPTSVDLVLTSLASLMREEPGNLKLDLKIGDATAGADLEIATKDGVQYAGPASINAPDLPALAALAGTELAEAPGFDSLSVKGDVEGSDTQMRLDNAQIGFDEIEAQGSLSLDWSGARPKASGVLSTEQLDLRPYMPPPAESPEGFPAWSEAPMDFASLNNIDADFDISTNAIYVNDLEFGESRLKLTIDAGRMTAEIPELAMYGGQGSGRLVVNARGATPSFAGAFDVGAVKAEPFAEDVLKNDNLLGLGSFKLNFTASGASQAAIMRSVSGSGGFDLADGAIKGVNIAGLVRAAGELTQGLNPAALQSAIAEARGPSQQTDFSEFLSDFSIANGLVNAPTISLTGPYLTMSGKGTVNLAEQTINLSLAPRATSTVDGEGGRAFSVPVKIGGTFSQPTIGIDAESLVRSGLQNTLQNVLNKDKTQNGDGETAEDAGTVEETLIKDGLGALFGKKKKPAQEEPAEEDPQQ